jgi:hypothetical protein
MVIARGAGRSEDIIDARGGVFHRAGRLKYALPDKPALPPPLEDP